MTILPPWFKDLPEKNKKIDKLANWYKLYFVQLTKQKIPEFYSIYNAKNEMQVARVNTPISSIKKIVKSSL